MAQMIHGRLITLYQSPAVASYGSLEWVKTLTNYFHAVSQQTASLKYILLSGHETTIMRLLSCYHYRLNIVPYYARGLNFSLYRRADKGYLRIPFNDQPIHLAGCQKCDCCLQEFKQRIAANGATR